MDAIDGIIERIKKAVRLANKTTEAGERETAMRLARNLAEKHGIAFDEVEVEDNAVGKARREEEVDFHTTDMVVEGRISSLMPYHFGVVMMMTHRGNKCRFSWFGVSINIDVAKYAADIMRRSARKAWRDVKKQEATLGFKLNRKAFMEGFFYRLHKKLLEHPIRNDTDQLAAERKKAEEEFEKYRQGNNVKTVSSTHNGDAASLYNGFMSADGVRLNRPCGTSTGTHAEVGRQMRLTA